MCKLLTLREREIRNWKEIGVQNCLQSSGARRVDYLCTRVPRFRLLSSDGFCWSNQSNFNLFILQLRAELYHDVVGLIVVVDMRSESVVENVTSWYAEVASHRRVAQTPLVLVCGNQFEESVKPERRAAVVALARARCWDYCECSPVSGANVGHLFQVSFFFFCECRSVDGTNSGEKLLDKLNFLIQKWIMESLLFLSPTLSRSSIWRYAEFWTWIMAIKMDDFSSCQIFLRIQTPHRSHQQCNHF